MTPGGTNNPTSILVPVVINEFMASNTRTIRNCAELYDDWIELYNTSGTAVDLSGFFLSDNLGNPTKWAFPEGTFIGPRGYLLVWADDQPCADTDLHAPFKLDASGEQIGLFAPDGRLIDGLTFPNQIADWTYGRWPDGAGSTFYFMDQPTPRASNFLTANNSPPALGIIGDQVVDEGARLSFTVSASDPDAPPQQLSFSLDSNAPDGATIDAQSGVFAWQPAEDQGPGVYTIEVSVTDNGSPRLSASRSLRITVIGSLAPGFPATATVANGVVTIAWQAIAGKTYQVQYSPDLNNLAWQVFGPNIVAGSSSASVTDTPGSTQRFYRVLRID